jgi:transposase
MAYRRTDFSLLVLTQPSAARRKILAAFRRAKMAKIAAAEDLGVSYNTLVRWIATLDLDREIVRLRARAKAEGWHHDGYTHGGRPRKLAS